ncbi:MAG: hypothetical protein LBT49_00430, partial [Prevotellaceae bacterium]|jgi:hypothetical protein|nr:hypothetical protein [Prevotellaceae bacterium]
MFPNNGSKLGQFHAGVQIRRNSRISLSNAAILGYPVGLIIENDKSEKETQSAAEQRGAISGVVFGGYSDNAANAEYDNTAAAVAILGSDKNKTYKDILNADNGNGDATQKSFSHTHALRGGGNNQTATVTDLHLNASYAPQSGSVLLNAAFTVPSGFDATGNGYAGAFKSAAAADNWTSGWANFDPQATLYTN